MSFILLGILNSQAAGAVGAGAYDLLETTVLTSSASSVSFTGLDSYTDYKHLQIRTVNKTDPSRETDDMQVQFNGDTGSNYAYHVLGTQGSTVFSSDDPNKSAITIGGTLGASTPNIFGSFVIDILDFSSDTKNTTIKSLGGRVISGDNYLNLTSGLYANTNDITEVLLKPSIGPNFVAGSRFSLYGIKG